MIRESKRNQPDENSGYEKRDADVRKTFIMIVAGIVVLALILVGLIEYFEFEKEKEIYEIVLKPESEELIKLREREDSILETYGIIDTLQGIYRIPIDSAMKEMLRDAGVPQSGE